MVSVVVACLNIGLNAMFIYGYLGFPRLEIAGAALATVLANGIGLVITVCMLHRKKNLWISLADIKCKAANSIANITKNLLVCVCTGFGYGGSIIVGNLLGEGNPCLNMEKRLQLEIMCGWAEIQ